MFSEISIMISRISIMIQRVQIAISEDQIKNERDFVSFCRMQSEISRKLVAVWARQAGSGNRKLS
jgi:hypothetical protein